MKKLYDWVDDFKDAILAEDYSEGQKTIITIKQEDGEIKIDFNYVEGE